MSSKHVWDSELYDEKLRFVSAYGKDVVQLLKPNEGEQVLDLGCGSGDLAYEITTFGASVTGIDLSENMIERAREKYPNISFVVGNVEHFPRNLGTYDAVFSNAALHWMKNNKQVTAFIWNSLKPGGRFVAEFGGKGNVETIINAIYEVLSEDYGIEAKMLNPWYFPSISEYSIILEQQGFKVTYAEHFDRLTKAEDGELGLTHWLQGFAGDFFRGFSEEKRTEAFQKISVKVRNQLFNDRDWYLDYKRLRVKAIKPE